MRRLVVNADDLGAGDARDLGILEAHSHGIVTSVSVLAQGPSFGRAARRLREHPGLDPGVHVNLSEGRPLSRRPRTLVDPATGCFWGKREARRRALEGLFDPEEVEREAGAQIDRLLGEGFPPSHVDGHQHLHVYGCVAAPVARAAASRGIRRYRRPADAFLPPVPLDPGRGWDLEEYRTQALRAHEAYAREGLRPTDAFAGAALSGHLTFETLAAVLARLPEGTTELMVHPGYAAGEAGFSGPARDAERRLLTDPAVRVLLGLLGIRLARWSDL
jgi:predicted glycoside hydrolase/deacetylase ChbG (UPF0249 family)